ncbi:SigE family RNA polymerase sigma factor [Nocardioides speluncae]|uniref:SigE family RNA polymerase sigma factor n=1 Tax=Nocardioides speluncae TaxID=2670337 RepID=UPI000D68741C|nr:SigE family RNA polymerase sigma factor [Nocardioides speluncae]
MRRAEREAAYSAYVAARQTHWRRVAYALCGDWHHAEDLLQIALTKLYVAWPKLAIDGREDAYVRQIIVRANIDEYRRPWRRERIGVEGPEPVAREELAFEDRSELMDALRDLSPMQRKVVVLRHWLGLSIEETATELKISAGTVKSHNARGLERLQSLITEESR